ncbi:hypothetical protein AMECASPLE_034040, partial [Ameca splendens]
MRDSEKFALLKRLSGLYTKVWTLPWISFGKQLGKENMRAGPKLRALRPLNSVRCQSAVFDYYLNLLLIK